MRNTSLVFSAQGELLARYDKIHSFKFDNGRERYDEARVIEGGGEPVSFELRDRNGQLWRVGLSVCYDLRFLRSRTAGWALTCCWCPAPSPT